MERNNKQSRTAQKARPTQIKQAQVEVESLIFLFFGKLGGGRRTKDKDGERRTDYSQYGSYFSAVVRLHWRETHPGVTRKVTTNEKDPK
jgi:hypothetical protein